jgi:nicotinate-nucleotide adenylyltransferase
LKHIGILGGSFNPVHLGHLILANIVLEKLKLNSILFIPCYLPPLKSSEEFAPTEARIKMLKLAIKDNPKFSFSDIEIKRKGKSYTIDTLREIKNNNSKLFFIIGADNIKDFNSWKKPKEILKLADLVVTNRGGVQVETPKKILGQKIIECIIPNIEISSSEIRKRVASKMSIKYFVPREVENFIVRNKLYQKRSEG